MKSFASASFFLLFEQIIRQTNPDLTLDQWLEHGVEWERTRHSFTGGTYSYAMEVFTAAHAGKETWKLVIAKEQWWGGRSGDIIKTHRWARPLIGKRASILAWFATRKRALDA